MGVREPCGCVLVGMGVNSWSSTSLTRDHSLCSPNALHGRGSMASVHTQHHLERRAFDSGHCCPEVACLCWRSCSWSLNAGRWSQNSTAERKPTKGRTEGIVTVFPFYCESQIQLASLISSTVKCMWLFLLHNICDEVKGAHLAPIRHPQM